MTRAGASREMSRTMEKLDFMARSMRAFTSCSVQCSMRWFCSHS